MIMTTDQWYELHHHPLMDHQWIWHPNHIPQWTTSGISLLHEFVAQITPNPSTSLEYY